MTFDEINAVAEMIRELPVLTAQDMAEITDLVQTGYMPNEKLAEYRPLIDAANARSNRADREARRACGETTMGGMMAREGNADER